MNRAIVLAAISSAVVLMLSVTTIPTSASYSLDKTYKLTGDGYITGTAKVACWQYDGAGAQVDIRIDVLKVFHSKGKNELSAYIIDLTKNGPESYIKIGNNVMPKDKYDYARFAQQFDAGDFPASDDAKACPIDSVGRFVVVVGTSPPSDSDTLDEGTVDIIAEAALSTSSTESKDTTEDASTSVGKEEPKVDTEEPKVEVEVEVEVEEPEIKVIPYSIRSELKLADQFGDRIEEAVTGQPVLVQTKVANNLNEEQPFVYILQVKDRQGFTVMLTWIKGTMKASTALDASISWTPEERGNYIIEVFVWKSLEDPGLPLSREMMVSVQE